MEDFRVDAGPVHNDGALVCPDLSHLSQLRVPLQGGQACSLHKKGVSQLGPGWFTKKITGLPK